MNKSLLIINPAAGRGRTMAGRDRIEGLFRASNIDFTTLITDSAEHCISMVRDARNQGFSNFISVGGDGTHHLVVNGIMKAASTNNIATVGIIPIGTGNDWARSHHIQRDIDKAVEVITAGRSVTHSVGRIEFIDEGNRTRYFVNVAGMCLDAEVVRTLGRSAISRLGPAAYFLGGLKEALVYKAPYGIVQCNGRKYEDRFVTIHAGICPYSGGGMSFVPHAGPENRDLAVTLIRANTVLSLLSNMLRVYNGTIGKYKYASLNRAETLRVNHTGSALIGVEADGEYLGTAPVRISCVPEAIRLFIPGHE